MSKAVAKKQSVIRSRVTLMTPKAARKILERNPANRQKNEDFILSLAAAIENGEWEANGVPIIIDEDGNLLDGQHRLEAVILANKPVEMLVVTGPSRSVFTTIDTGMKRSISHMLHIEGESNCNVLGAAVSWLFKLTTGSVFATGRAKTPRARQAVELLHRHSPIRDSVTVGRSVKHVMSASIATCLHYLFGKVNHEKADEFFAKLETGEGLRKTQAVYLLREQLLANRGSKRKLTSVAQVALAIKAFNVSMNGDNMKLLRWGGDEPFPEIKGLPKSS